MRFRPDLVSLTPAARMVVAAIVDVGGRPLVVGGAVRDALFELPDSKDIDIEVYGLADVDALQRALSVLGDVSQRGQSFGVLALRVDGEDFDVSFPRRDSVNGTGHRGFDITVDPTLSFDVAFGRRDFTINAIGWDPVTGEVIDPYDGQSDIASRVLRHTTDAFAEDPLRVLRAMQFAGRFGLTMAPETVTESRRVSSLMQRAGGIRNVVSRERIWGEWQKLVRRGVHMEAAMTVLRGSGLSELFPELHALIGVEQDADWHPEGDVWTHMALSAQAASVVAWADGLSDEDREVAVLGAMCHDFGKATHTQNDGARITSRGHACAGAEPAESFLTDIGAPRHLIERIVPLVREHMRHIGIDSPNSRQVRRLLRALNPAGKGPSIYDWARVVDADFAGRGSGAKVSPASSWVRVAEALGDAKSPATGILTGAHLIAAGLKPGPQFGVVLSAALSAQDDGQFEDEAGALQFLARHLS